MGSDRNSNSACLGVQCVCVRGECFGWKEGMREVSGLMEMFSILTGVVVYRS